MLSHLNPKRYLQLQSADILDVRLYQEFLKYCMDWKDLKYRRYRWYFVISWSIVGNASIVSNSTAVLYEFELNWYFAISSFSQLCSHFTTNSLSLSSSCPLEHFQTEFPLFLLVFLLVLNMHNCTGPLSNWTPHSLSSSIDWTVQFTSWTVHHSVMCCFG